MNSPNYYAILPSDVRYDDRLICSAKLLFAEITALSDKKGYCFASNKYFADLYKVTPRTIQNWLQSLADAGYIKAEYDNGVRKIFHGGMKISSWGYENFFTHNNKYNNTNNKDKYKEEISSVISYLNSASGKRFRETDSNSKLIRARLSEGFTVDDCMKVIDNKVAAWKGTEFEQYLRPNTLFRASKFEGYLNEKQSKAKIQADFEYSRNNVNPTELEELLGY